MECTDMTEVHKEFGGDRLPPGQRETEAFPVLSKDGVPDWDPETWQFHADGAVERELSLSLSAFRSLPHETQRQDFHCVTGWSRLDCAFTGVTFPTIAEQAGVTDAAESVMFTALDGYTTSLPLSDCLRDDVLFAWALDGKALPEEHGGPLRVVTPHKYAYKGAKWVTGVEFLTDHERGYWEKRGYSDAANPWHENRYS
ncbi:sulfite oxidase-like oxidoreductase [Halocatena pleomorpha]|uniref:Sulfite oxidase-like oxidoreductase n=1 Tax=Halocatena pleomorpha TaxID=1785090 RepID=A0A3P3R9W0_9EURY|nr:sulfite oxidase-like oxidoreductase [Halocatena pleomorpha]RRJ30271.1 sulfite oxidase-like oxidoreductase [Halocatena pleomorpha]